MFSPNDNSTRRLAEIVAMMREMSQKTDPQEMVQSYGARMRQMFPSDGRISISRRDLQHPFVRITRSTRWKESINPWKEVERLPVFAGGLLSQLIYGDEPVIIDDLKLDSNDPAAEYLFGHRSVMAIPLYDQGVSLNMVILLMKEPHAFSRETFPDLVWMSNLFGRATSNLVLSSELKQAYEALDREMRSVGEIQRSLLPSELPQVPHLDLAAYYQPSQRAGGDYYDFFSLSEDRCGILIADVSGHGTPAAVIMAIMHAMAHTRPDAPTPPGSLLTYLNHHLTTRYTSDNARFVTAFYGIFDPHRRTLTYARAGHPPPRLKRCRDGSLHVLTGAGGLPLGVDANFEFEDTVQQLTPGDQIVFFTDGIIETRSPAGELFGAARLDQTIAKCRFQAFELRDRILAALEEFASGRPADDDETLVIARVG